MSVGFLTWRKSTHRNPGPWLRLPRSRGVVGHLAQRPRPDPQLSPVIWGMEAPHTPSTCATRCPLGRGPVGRRGRIGCRARSPNGPLPLRPYKRKHCCEIPEFLVLHADLKPSRPPWGQGGRSPPARRLGENSVDASPARLEHGRYWVRTPQ